MPIEALLEDLDPEHGLGAELLELLIRALDVVAAALERGLLLGELGVLLVEAALDKGSRDNITCICVFLSKS